jgi:hypothetical protein
MSQGLCAITLRVLADRAAVIVLVCFDESLEGRNHDLRLRAQRSMPLLGIY